MNHINMSLLIKLVILIGVPILYYGFGARQNIVIDLLWFYVFAMLSKDFIMKVVLKKRYCSIEEPPSSK